MTKDEMLAKYMMACLDARRDPALLPIPRLLAAYRTLSNSVSPEVPFNVWCLRSGYGEQLQAQAEEEQKAEQSATAEGLRSLGNALKASGVDVTVTDGE